MSHMSRRRAHLLPTPEPKIHVPEEEFFVLALVHTLPTRNKDATKELTHYEENQPEGGVGEFIDAQAIGSLVGRTKPETAGMLIAANMSTTLYL